MKKSIFLKIAVTLIMITPAYLIAQSDFHQFKVNTLEGQSFDFATLIGKKVLVVNTASKCGLTPQLEQLQAIYKKYGGERFVIIGFPANNFANQEPGTAVEIREFCNLNYGVTFPMMEKVSVKGNDQHPVYEWLTQKVKNGVEDYPVQWNFQKFLIDEKGHLYKSFSPKTKPDDPEIINWILSN